MPVHLSYDTEAAQPHLPALAAGIPPAAHPAPCVRLTTLLVCSPPVCLWSLAYIPLPKGWKPLFHSAWHTRMVLPPSGNPCGSGTGNLLGWSYHQQETPPLWLALFVLLMGNKPMWQPYHTLDERHRIVDGSVVHWFLHISQYQVIKHNIMSNKIIVSSYILCVYNLSVYVCIKFMCTCTEREDGTGV